MGFLKKVVRYFRFVDGGGSATGEAELMQGIVVVNDAGTLAMTFIDRALSADDYPSKSFIRQGDVYVMD